MKELVIGIIVAVVGGIAGAIGSYMFFRASPVAFGECKPSRGPAPLTVACVNSSNYYGHVVWDLGDSSQRRVKDQDRLEHTYEAPGTYTILLRAYGNGEDEWRYEIRVDEARSLPAPRTVRVIASLTENRVVQTRPVPIDQTKDDHPVVFGPDSRPYSETFRAAPGFRILDAKFHETSASRAGDLRSVISPDGSSITFSFRLTSGPSVDQYRGWLHGVLEITEERTEAASDVILSDRLRLIDAGTYALSSSVPLERITSVQIIDEQGRVLARGNPKDALVAVDDGLTFSLDHELGKTFLKVEPIQ